MPATELARLMTRQAALLVLLGLLTGGLVAAASTGAVAADAHAALASHLNALLGAFWIVGVAWSLPFVHLPAPALTWLARLLIGAQYANWAFTALKALWQVSGVGLGPDPRNNAIFVALNVTVVVPSLAASALWVVGLFRMP